MLLFIACATVVFSAWSVLRVPANFLRAYRTWFLTRHGIGFNLALIVLFAVVGASLLVTLMQPGLYPMVELVDAVVLAVVCPLMGCEFHRFRRATSR